MKHPSYIVAVKPKGVKYFPKRVLFRRSIENISFKTHLSLWIPDTPDYPLQPMLTLTINTTVDRFRIQFESVKELLIFISELELFIHEHYEELRDELELALKEWAHTQSVRALKKKFPSLVTGKLDLTSKQDITGENKVYVLNSEGKDLTDLTRK